jgi:hypothetical protein
MVLQQNRKRQSLDTLYKDAVQMRLGGHILGIDKLKEAVKAFSSNVAHVVVEANVARFKKNRRIVSFCAEAQ